jgi:hypothetical protein
LEFCCAKQADVSNSRMTSRRFMQIPECSMLKHFTLIGRPDPGEKKSRYDSAAGNPYYCKCDELTVVI